MRISFHGRELIEKSDLRANAQMLVGAPSAMIFFRSVNSV